MVYSFNLIVARSHLARATSSLFVIFVIFFFVQNGANKTVVVVVVVVCIPKYACYKTKKTPAVSITN